MSDFLSSFQQDFIEKDRYLYLLRGLGNTLLIAVLAVLLGIVVGFLSQLSVPPMINMVD